MKYLCLLLALMMLSIAGCDWFERYLDWDDRMRKGSVFQQILAVALCLGAALVLIGVLHITEALMVLAWSWLSISFCWRGRGFWDCFSSSNS